MIYKTCIFQENREKLLRKLYIQGLLKMTDDNYFAEIVVPKGIFSKLVTGITSESTHRKRGYKDIFGKPFFQQKGDQGKIYTRPTVRVWNEDKLLQYMKEGRRVCS